MSFYDPRLGGLKPDVLIPLLQNLNSIIGANNEIGPEFTIRSNALPPMRPAMPLAGKPRQQGPTGLAALLSRPGLRDALIATGSTLLAQADQGGSTFGDLGRALPFGLQALQQGRQEAEIDALMESAPPEMKQLLKALPAQQRVGALLSLMKKPESQVIPEGAAVLEDGKEIYKNVRPEKAEDPLKGFPAEAQLVLWGMGVDPATATMEQREAALTRYAELQTAGKGPLVQIDTGDKAASSAAQALGGDAATRVVSKAATADAAIGLVDNIATAERLLDDPAMKKVAGPASSIRTVAQRLGDDPRARELAAQYDILTSDVVLQKVKAFKGPLSEKELAFLERASAADRNMTVEELQAGLKLLRRISERDLKDYVNEVDSFNPAEFDVTEGQMQQYRGLADRARAVTSGKAKDPLGLR